ncbi:vasa B [Oopsacas minuta]|uniref:RNA helicase n=1 Tax=Oopsacas minuta TaxID=111878 RepID=A0A1W5RU36_9METZ|nr:vasa B [Oopsacas minuta]KAI6655590.1 vasa B [Oopsacas minuta]
MASGYDSGQMHQGGNYPHSDRSRGNYNDNQTQGSFRNGFPKDMHEGNGRYQQQGQPDWNRDAHEGRNYQGSGYSRDYNGGGRYQSEDRRGNPHNGYDQRDRYNSDRQAQQGYQGRNSSYRGTQQRGYSGSYDRSRGRGEYRGGGGGRGRGRGDGRDNNGPSKPNIPYIPSDNQAHFDDPIPQGDMFYRYQDLKVDITGDDIPKHVNSFGEIDFCKSVFENIAKSNYKEMTPVQKYAIPAILARRDLMGCAETGSGKTATFLLPIISSMLKLNICSDPNQKGIISPTALVLVPTRELAIQVYQEAQRFSYGSDIQPGLYYGGTSISHQNRVLTKGCHILVATPGRLLDCLRNRRITLKMLRFLIVDEADRMFDIGFLPDVEDICTKYEMPSRDRRQTILFSATLPKEVQRLADNILSTNYLFITVGKQGKPAHNIKQVILEVPTTEKMRRVIKILKDCNGKKVIVFVENKRQTDLLASQICQEHMQATSIHGSRMQQEREQALYDFKSGKRMILIATGVAARGLDIKNVDHVINYDLPLNDFNEYVHRIGRTGRIGNVGLATSFFDLNTDSCIARRLVHLLSFTQQDVPQFLEDSAEQAIGTQHGPSMEEFGGTDRRPNYKNSPRYRGHDQQYDYGNQGSFDSFPTQSHQQQLSPPRTTHQSPPSRSKQSDWD